jgi:hypothetical protein
LPLSFVTCSVFYSHFNGFQESIENKYMCLFCQAETGTSSDLLDGHIFKGSDICLFSLYSKSTELISFELQICICTCLLGIYVKSNYFFWKSVSSWNLVSQSLQLPTLETSILSLIPPSYWISLHVIRLVNGTLRATSLTLKDATAWLTAPPVLPILSSSLVEMPPHTFMMSYFMSSKLSNYCLSKRLAFC